jgi:hypothetical protein
MAKFFRILAYVWFVIFGVVFLFSSAMIIYKDGFWAYAEIMSPYNVTNLIVTILALSPGIGAWLLAQWLDKRKAARARKLGTTL